MGNAGKFRKDDIQGENHRQNQINQLQTGAQTQNCRVGMLQMNRPSHKCSIDQTSAKYTVSFGPASIKESTVAPEHQPWSARFFLA
jgi:hypothetical protein